MVSMVHRTVISSSSFYSKLPLRLSGAVAVAVVGCPLITGCSRSGSLAIAPPPKGVQVSLSQIAARPPEWSAVAQFDRIAEGSAANVAPPSLPQPPPSSSLSSADIHSKLPVDARLAAERQSRQLALASERAAAQVNDRLEREQTRLMAAAGRESEARVAAGVESVRQQAVRKYLNELPALLGPAAARRISLQVQIDALGVNALPSNPATAPLGYWDKLLQARRDALASLGSPQHTAERQALEQISAAVQSARTALQSTEDAHLASYEAELDANQRDVIARQQSSLQREHRDLLTVSAELTREINAPLTSAPEGGVAAGASVPHSNNGTLVGAGTSRRDEGMLVEQRRRLVAEILQSTRRKAALAASELNYTIVDWNSGSPDQDAMSKITGKMASDNFR